MHAAPEPACTLLHARHSRFLTSTTRHVDFAQRCTIHIMYVYLYILSSTVQRCGVSQACKKRCLRAICCCAHHARPRSCHATSHTLQHPPLAVRCHACCGNICRAPLLCGRHVFRRTERTAHVDNVFPACAAPWRVFYLEGWAADETYVRHTSLSGRACAPLPCSRMKPAHMSSLL
jgi:hypothetical protein